jgi:hypothetical protein
MTGGKSGVLHPICRIGALNRGNLAAMRQIESAVSSRLPDPPTIGHTETSMSKPDPMLAQIAAHFTRYDVERSGGSYEILDRRTSNLVARPSPFQTPIASNSSSGQMSKIAGQPCNMGRMKLMLESAHEIVENDPIFRIPRGR